MLHRRPSSEGTEETLNAGAAPPKPCWFMKGLLSALAENSLTGISRWYAEHHAKNCPHCAATLSSLRIVRSRLRALGLPDEAVTEEEKAAADSALTKERREALEIAWVEIDTENGREPIGLETT